MIEPEDPYQGEVRKLCIDLIRENASLALEPLPVPPLRTALRDRFLRSVPGVRAVVFDIYGTLFVSGVGDIGTISRSDDSKSESKVPSPGTSGPLGNLEELRSYFVAAVGEQHRRLRDAGARFPEVRVEELWARFAGLPHGVTPAEFALRYELSVNPVYPMPGAAETIGFLNAAGISLGIVSNAQAFTPLLFEAFFARALPELGFRDELCSWSYRGRIAKPDPDLFLPVKLQLQDLGIKIDEALYVGNDMLNDVYAASTLGFKTCLFAGDGRSLRLREDWSQCESLLPDTVIPTLDSLVTILNLQARGW